jgi:transposase InsO family protein
VKRLHAENVDEKKPIFYLCRLFGHTKQAYYKDGNRLLLLAVKERMVVDFVRSRRKNCPGMGGEKLWYKYKEEYPSEYLMGRDAFMNVLYTNRLTLRKKRRRCRTTDSSHPYPLYENLVKGLEVTYFGQVIVSDITYVRMGEKFCFLSIVTDVYSRSIIGYYVGESLAVVNTIKALEMALERLGNIPREKGCIHHSDRGVQYASYEYTDMLKECNIAISMTQNGDPRDNAIAERVNGILKGEFLDAYSFKDIGQVRTEVDKAIHYYNYERPHRALNMETPVKMAGKEDAYTYTCW